MQRRLAALGLNPTQVDELQNMPMEKVIAALRGPAGAAFGPVVDGKTLPTNPFDPTAPDASATVPMLLGSTETEMGFFAGGPLFPYSLRQPQWQGCGKLAGLQRDHAPDHDSRQPMPGCERPAQRRAAGDRQHQTRARRPILALLAIRVAPQSRGGTIIKSGWFILAAPGFSREGNHHVDSSNQSSPYYRRRYYS